MWELDWEEGWVLKNWCFWTVVLEKTLESPLDCKEISPGCSLEGLMLKLKLQYFSHLMQRIDSLEKTLILGAIRGQEKGTTEGEMAGWHHWLDGHEFEWTTGVGDGQGGLVCCNSWGCKESDRTERLNWTELNDLLFFQVVSYLLGYYTLTIMLCSQWDRYIEFTLEIPWFVLQPHIPRWQVSDRGRAGSQSTL